MIQSTAAKIYSLLASARSLTTSEIMLATDQTLDEVWTILSMLAGLDMVEYANGNWSRPDVGRVEP